ncbi:MAG: hypothetical protein AB1295_04525 [Candidatus Micrarchaeota archaeon]
MLGFLGQFRPAMKQPGEETAEKPPEQQKSSSADEFFKSAGTKNFVNNWVRKGEPNYTKRGINQLLRELFPRYESDKAVIKAADNVLKMLRGEDGLTGFLAGMKATPSGIMKGLKSILGGKG